MKIFLTNPPEKFELVYKYAASFLEKQYSKTKGIVPIVFVKRTKCAACIYDCRLKPEVEIPSRGFAYELGCLFHEVVHADQVLRGDMKPGGNAKEVWWRGKNYKDVSKPVYKYLNTPWEREARQKSIELMVQFFQL